MQFNCSGRGAVDGRQNYSGIRFPKEGTALRQIGLRPRFAQQRI